MERHSMLRHQARRFSGSRLAISSNQLCSSLSITTGRPPPSPVHRSSCPLPSDHPARRPSLSRRSAAGTMPAAGPPVRWPSRLMVRQKLSATLRRCPGRPRRSHRRALCADRPSGSGVRPAAARTSTDLRHEPFVCSPNLVALIFRPDMY